MINGPESETKRRRLKPEQLSSNPGGLGGWGSIAGGNKITMKSHQLAAAEATWVSLRVGKMHFLLSRRLIILS